VQRIGWRWRRFDALTCIRHGIVVMSEETIQIKRYPNRRFYARNTSKYVSIPEIEEMIRQGHTIEVRDSQTGEELTHQVLTQIILDRQPEKIQLFPVDMLHSIVRSNDMMTDFLRDYFRHAITYLDYLQQYGKSGRKLASPMHWATAWLESFSPKNGQSKSSPAPASDTSSAEEELGQRVAELEERIRQLESAQQPPN
jgi:polyhydroxyalkanoate synthesis repressor PhaR